MAQGQTYVNSKKKKGMGKYFTSLYLNNALMFIYTDYCIKNEQFLFFSLIFLRWKIEYSIFFIGISV